MEYRHLQTGEFDELESRILYEDNHLIIVNKAAGEIVQGDKTGDEPLVEKYKAFIAARDGKPGKVFLGVPHRIDRPVGGVTVFAKTSKALERMSTLFREGGVHKTYWALVCREPQAPQALLQHWLTRDEQKNKSFVLRHGEDAPSRSGAKLAKMEYRLIGKTERYFLLEVKLLTGRHHQIRCQLAAIGCPIKGDLKYGAPRSNPDGSISLLAKNINFVHPVSGKNLDITAPLPVSWKGVHA